MIESMIMLRTMTWATLIRMRNLLGQSLGVTKCLTLVVVELEGLPLSLVHFNKFAFLLVTFCVGFWNEQIACLMGCVIGAMSMQLDPLSESRIEKPHPVYVPRDETFEEIKQDTFSAGRLKALFHNLLPSLAATLSSSDVPFKCFSDIDKLYIDGVVLRDEEQKGVMENLLVGKVMKQVLSAGESLLKYEIPAVIKGMLVKQMQHNL